MEGRAAATPGRTLVAWLQDQLAEAGNRGGDNNNMQDAPTAENTALQHIGLRISHDTIADMTAWIAAHIAAALDRAPPRRWRWDWAMWGWLMERAGAQRLPMDDPELFGQLMAELGVPARSRRQTPYIQ